MSTAAAAETRTCIFRSVREGDLAAVERHLLSGLVSVDAKGGQYQSAPLLEACRWHEHKVAVLLLQHGADVRSTGGGSWSALHFAAHRRDNPALVQLLIDAGAALDALDYCNRTPLHIAASKGHSDAARALLEAGAAVNACNTDGKSILHYAAVQGSKAVVSLLLAFGADVTAVDVQRETPLFAAVRAGQRLAAAVLVQAGADTTALNCWGELAGNLAKGYKVRMYTTMRHALHSLYFVFKLRCAYFCYLYWCQNARYRQRCIVIGCTH
jgi:ankyrin repeat protein